MCRVDGVGGLGLGLGVGVGEALVGALGEAGDLRGAVEAEDQEVKDQAVVLYDEG